METHRETARIEGFSDAVFAIAITLLALDLRVPTPGPPGLLPQLLVQWPDHLGFLAAFASITVFWLLHHRLFTLVRHADTPLILLNSLLLLGVVVTPFWIRVLTIYANDPDQNIAAMLRDATFVAVIIIFFLLWRHASRNHLLDPEANPQVVRTVGRSFALAPILYLGSLSIAPISVVGSTAANILIAVFLSLLY